MFEKDAIAVNRFGRLISRMKTDKLLFVTDLTHS